MAALSLPFSGCLGTVAHMEFWYEKIVRPYFFRYDPEKAHESSVRALALLGHLAPLRAAMECWAQLPTSRYAPVKVFGLDFPNRVGMAAGFDKNAEAWMAAAALGFGHVEIGTITAQAQPGNPKPRLFRYPSEEAVINRMGFNNEGAAAVAARLARQPARGNRRIPLGINLGKTKVVPLEDATADYLASFELLADHADYVVLNVSSPNTPDLRKLQDEERLRELLAAVSSANRSRSIEAVKARVPVLLKIAPDLTWPQIDSVLGVISDYKLDGIIATNTTLARPGSFETVCEEGGLSGPPLRRRSTEIINYIARRTEGRLPIIGSGGIGDLVAAGEKLDAGATLVQIYTGMIYRGPFFARDVALALGERDRRH
ncbi:MAG: quinone-dependent dihydroorotate dehydrogenase [Opitutaceae bacterium]|jgi:dihydroorotate dehydrogenase